MVQGAWAASRTKGSHYKNKFEQRCIRKTKKKALIAIARKLLTVVWHVLNENQPFDHKMLPVYDPNKSKSKMKYHRKELEKLEALGFSFT